MVALDWPLFSFRAITAQGSAIRADKTKRAWPQTWNGASRPCKETRPPLAGVVRTRATGILRLRTRNEGT